MSKEGLSHSPGAAGAELSQSTGKVLQKIFQPDQESGITDTTDQELSPSSGSSMSVQSHPYWKRLPNSVRHNIEKVINKNTNIMEQSTAEGLQNDLPKASIDYRKGYKIGVELKQLSGLSQEQLQAVTEHVLKAQPGDHYLQGLAQGIDFEKHAKQKEQVAELNNHSHPKVKEEEKGR